MECILKLKFLKKNKIIILFLIKKKKKKYSYTGWLINYKKT